MTSAAADPEGTASPAASAGKEERSVRSRLTDMFEEQASKCASPEDLRLLLEAVTRELGFEYFALLHHRCVLFSSDRLVRIDNYPDGWAEELLTRHDVAADPVHLASLRTNAGFGWDELEGLLPLSPSQRAILERSRHHGLGP